MSLLEENVVTAMSPLGFFRILFALRFKTDSKNLMKILKPQVKIKSEN